MTCSPLQVRAFCSNVHTYPEGLKRRYNCTKLHVATCPKASTLCGHRHQNRDISVSVTQLHQTVALQRGKCTNTSINWVRFLASPSDICGRPSGTETQFLSECFSFLLSVSFHQYSILFSPVSINPPMLHTQSSPVTIIPPILHTVFACQYHSTNTPHCFPLSVSFHQ